MMKPTIALVFTFIVSAMCGCLNDWDTGHGSADYATRLYSYSPKSAAQVKNSNELTFMSFNLQSGFLLSCTNNPSAQIAQMVSSDYVGTQETVQNVDTRCSRCVLPKLIADGTGMSSRFLMTIPFRTGQYGINAATSQNILETKYQLFNYGGVEQRGAIAIRTQPPALKGRNLWFINTHVEYYVWAARQSQIAQLITFAKTLVAADPNCILVATGDYNGGPWDAMYGTMKAYFQNSWEVSNGGSIEGGNTHPAGSPGTRFDHIWYRVPSGVSASPRVEVLNVQLSDHRPLRAVIKFTGANIGTSGPSPTPAPTPAPTKAPTSAPAPVTSPPKGATSAPTPAPAAASGNSGSCSVSISSNSASPVVIKNTGSKPVKNLVLSFSPSLPSNNWNFVSQGSNRYTLPSYAYQSLAANGQTYSSSGYYTQGPVPTVTVASISC